MACAEDNPFHTRNNAICHMHHLVNYLIIDSKHFMTGMRDNHSTDLVSKWEDFVKSARIIHPMCLFLFVSNESDIVSSLLSSHGMITYKNTIILILPMRLFSPVQNTVHHSSCRFHFMLWSPVVNSKERNI